jgi:hypothetical protein
VNKAVPDDRFTIWQNLNTTVLNELTLASQIVASCFDY